jgi:hypothetical protein
MYALVRRDQLSFFARLFGFECEGQDIHFARVRVNERFSFNDRWPHSLRYRHEFQNVAIEIPEVNASSAIPIVKLCVVECPWSTPKYESSGFHSMQDRVEFCVAKVERIMVALESFCAVAKEQGKTFVDPHRCKVAVVTLGGKPKELREKAGGSFLVMCWNDGVVEYNRHHPLLTGFNDLCLADVSAVQCENNADIYDSLNLANLRAGAHQLRQY